MTSTTETGTATAEERKATKKARAGARGAHVAPKKGKAAKKAKAPKKSVRGFISGTLTKKMGLTVVSAKGEDGERSYSIKA